MVRCLPGRSMSRCAARLRRCCHSENCALWAQSVFCEKLAEKPAGCRSPPSPRRTTVDRMAAELRERQAEGAVAFDQGGAQGAGDGLLRPDVMAEGKMDADFALRPP